MNDERVVVELEGVSKRYIVGPEPLIVLRDVCIRVMAGDCLAIVGPSGSGKSTLLNLMGTLDAPSDGRLRFKGREVGGLSPKELARLRNREIGFVFQQHHLLPQCTVIENVLVPTLIGACTPDAYDRARELLDRVGLGARLHHVPGQISGGERQRVAVVRALINRPSLLLADEPTGSLNAAGADDLAQLLIDLNRDQGMALVVVTHSMAIAERIGHIYELRDGVLAPRA